MVCSLRHGRKPHETATLEAEAVRLRRCRDKVGGGSDWVGRERPPVLAIQRRGNHVRVVLQGCQDFCCVRLVRKRQGGGAVGGKNAGARGQLTLYRLAERHDLVGYERSRRQEED